MSGPERSFPPPSEALLRAVADARPVAPRSPGRQLAMLMATSAAAVAVALVVLGVRPDMGALPVPWLAVMGGAWLVSYLALAWMALWPRRGEVLPRARLAGMAGFLAFAMMACLALAWTEGAYSSAAGFLAFMHQAMGCLVSGLMVALLPLGLALMFVRHTSPDRPRWLAAAAGAQAGALGGLALLFHCPISDGHHVAAAHATVILAAAMVATVVASIAARRRA